MSLKASKVTTKKKIALSFLAFLLLLSSNPAFAASPWAAEPSYVGKTTGKLEYGLKNSAFGWLQMFKESKDPKYKTEWEGFCTGIARSAFYMGSGLIQLMTFPIPVDFPDVGTGLYFPPTPPPNFAKREKKV